MWSYHGDQVSKITPESKKAGRTTNTPTKTTELGNLIITGAQFPPSCPYLATKIGKWTQESIPMNSETTQLDFANLVRKQEAISPPTAIPSSQANSATSEPIEKLFAHEWNFFVEFTNGNTIHPFRKDMVPGLGEQASKNDALILSHYETIPYAYMGQKETTTLDQLRTPITT